MPDSFPLLAVYVHELAGVFDSIIRASGGEGLLFPVAGEEQCLREMLMIVADLERCIAWAVLTSEG
jgi:hypothetical protein